MKVGDDHRTPITRCLDCGQRLDGATCVGKDVGPSPGDISVCISCGHIMAFAQDLTMRALTNEEIIAIAGDPYVLAIQKGRAALQRRKREDDAAGSSG